MSIRITENAALEPQAISDVEIVNNLVAGQRQAFEQFYQRYSKLIYHCVRSRAQGSDVDEFFQDFMLKLHATNYKALDSWGRSSSFTNYLSRVVRNFVIDRQRSSSSIPKPIGSAVDLDDLIGADARKLPDQLSEERDLRKAGIRAWSLLSTPRDKCLICNIYHRDKDLDAISLQINVSGGALRKAIFDAKKRFILSLRKLAPEFFPV